MSWIRIDDTAGWMEKLKALVEPQETSCMETVALLTGAKEQSRSPVAHKSGDAIDAVLFFASYGRIIPVLSPQFLFHQEDVRYVSALAGNAVFLPTSVSGRTEAVDMFLERFSCGQREQAVEHYIMELNKDNFHPEPIPDKSRIKILRGSMRHLLPLLPLQRTYEIQEVLLDPDSIDTAETFRWLKSILTQEICFYARCGFRYVAKANTNCRGFSHIQIGGVFTKGEFRRKGYGYHTVSALCSYIIDKEHKIPSLFVKQDNINAINLYRKLGFEIKDTIKTVYLD